MAGNAIGVDLSRDWIDVFDPRRGASRVAEGLTLAAGAGAAVRARFRPILITVGTTVIGMVPLLAETSLQAQVLKPLVVSVVFGMVASTILVLLVLPALYAILDDLGLARAYGRQAEPDGADNLDSPRQGVPAQSAVDIWGVHR